jgi:hypothetical protein
MDPDSILEGEVEEDLPLELREKKHSDREVAYRLKALKH